MAPRQSFQPLSRRYAIRTCGLTLGLLLLSGASETYFGYRESMQHIEETQSTLAAGAANEIAGYVGAIEIVLKDISKLPWSQQAFDADQGRAEFHRAMRLAPALVECRLVDKHGREKLFASRATADRVDSGLMDSDTSSADWFEEGSAVRHSRTYFRDGYLPAVRMAVPAGEDRIVATVDLRLLGDVVTRLQVGSGGLAYVVDDRGMLIAHPRATDVLRRVDLSHAEQVTQARTRPSLGVIQVRALTTTDLAERPVIVTGATVRGTGWLLFVEQPRSAALQPVWATLSRSLALMAAGGIAALFIGVAFARRMAAPIVALRNATAGIASGRLEINWHSKQHDEIDDVARDFNDMVQRLRELYANLETKVAERTAQLSAARDDAERANAAKTRFLAAASHDLRQPMHSISLLLGVLQSRLDSPEHLALADKIQSSVATMESLFGNLLDISKLDAGAVQAHVEDVDLGWLLHRLEQTWAPQAADKGLRLRVRGCDAIVRGDAVLLERIAGNLVSNAIRYTRRGGVLVACRRRGSQVELQVWDSGPGIEPRFRDAIFEEFFRIEAPGTGAEKGLGLGLSIVQRCAHILGYGLSIDSRVGHGTVFRLSLPVAAASPASSRQAAPQLAASRQALAGRFIVVVDDEAMNAQALVDALQACRCHVVAAASCDEALALLQSHLRVPDLVVTDYQLGGGRDGIEVISRLRQHYDDDIPAVMVTANTDAGLQALAAEHRARLLHKPIGLQRLLEEMLASLPY